MKSIIFLFCIISFQFVINGFVVLKINKSIEKIAYNVEAFNKRDSILHGYIGRDTVPYSDTLIQVMPYYRED